MMLSPSVVTARTLPEAWHLCLREVIISGYDYVIDEGSFAGSRRRELDHITLQVTHPGTLPLVPLLNPGVPVPTSSDYVDEYVKYLLSTDKAEREEYTYGEYIAPQLFTVVERLRKNPNTNQTTIMIGTPDMVNSTDPPCLRLIDIRVRYGAVHFICYFRSWDCWAGLPTNLAGLQLVKQMVAEDLGLEDGEFIVSSKGLHLYDYSWDWARLVTGMLPSMESSQTAPAG